MNKWIKRVLAIIISVSVNYKATRKKSEERLKPAISEKKVTSVLGTKSVKIHTQTSNLITGEIYITKSGMTVQLCCHVTRDRYVPRSV